MPRCRRRSETLLTGFHEYELTSWLGWHIPGLSPDRDGLARLWRQHRETIMPAWLRSCPGVRPWVCYVVGELPPPPLVKPPREFSTAPARLPDGGLLHEWHCYAEPEHLRSIGEVDAAEWRRYLKQREELGYRWYPRCQYESVAVDD
jgi:hypothetical protein